MLSLLLIFSHAGNLATSLEVRNTEMKCKVNNGTAAHAEGYSQPHKLQTENKLAYVQYKSSLS